MENILGISTNDKLEKMEIYSLTGVLVQRAGADIKSIDISSFNSGSYIEVVFTPQKIYRQIIMKK